MAGGSIRAKDYAVYLNGAAEGDDSYARQTARINGSASGGAGGVYLAGGGRVFIGPNGFVSAGSDDGAAVCSEGDEAKLLVSLELDGRLPSEALGGAIVNKKGTETGATLGSTLLYVNGVLMYDEDGATGATAPNGAYDIVSVAADTTTDGQLSLGFAEATSTAVAPRAAVYEAAPGFLLRLDGGGVPILRAPASGKASAGESPLWTRLSGGRGSFEASSGSTVGADFDMDRWEAAFGADIPLGGGLTGAVGLRFVSGSADASAPTGGGGIDAEGFGVTGALSWSGTGGYFAAGRASATDYDLDISSSGRGALARSADATVLSWGAEAGRRAPLFEDASLTVRAWLDRSEADMDGLTDAAGSRLSLADGERTTAGAGFGVETLQALEGGGELALTGFAGAAFALDGETAMTVSGAKLRSEADGARVQLGLGADWRLGGGMTLAAGLSADGLDSGDRVLSASLALRMTF